MSSFASVAGLCRDNLLSWVAISAEQVEAAGKTSAEPAEQAEQAGLQGRDLGLVRAFPLPTDSIELARHVNEFLAERPAY